MLLRKCAIFLVILLIGHPGQASEGEEVLGFQLEKGRTNFLFYPLFGVERYPALNPWFEFDPRGVEKKTALEGSVGLGFHILPQGNLSYSFEQSLGSRFSLFTEDDCTDTYLCGHEPYGSSGIFLHSLKGSLQYRF